MEKTRFGGYEPDVAIRLKDGSYHLIEYASKSQTGAKGRELNARLQDAAAELRKTGARVTTEFNEYRSSGGVGNMKPTTKSCGNWVGGC